MNADQSKSQNPKSKYFWLIIPSLLLIAALAFDLLPILRGNDEWRWPLRPVEAGARLLVPIVTLGLYVFLGARWLKALSAKLSHVVMSAGFSCSSLSQRRLFNFRWLCRVAPPLLEFSVPRFPFITVAISHCRCFA
jgi:hypothetical protein